MPAADCPLVRHARALSRRLAGCTFGPPVACVYRPLDYAWAPHRAYLERYGRGPRRVLFLGMNPGPWGMAQTGVPFGDPAMVRDWLRLDGTVGHPPREHPARPVLGLAGTRREVSGTRLWGWARDRWGTPERFFQKFFVANWCPLAFLESGGRNLTPDKLPAAERAALAAPCDRALRATVAVLQPRIVVGVGAFAAERARLALADTGVAVGTVLHPSPASPRANRGWAEQAERDLRALGIEP